MLFCKVKIYLIEHCEEIEPDFSAVVDWYNVPDNLPENYLRLIQKALYENFDYWQNLPEDTEIVYLDVNFENNKFNIVW